MFFVLHGLIFSTLLFIKSVRSGSKADRWLGYFVLLCALYVCPFMLGYAGWYAGGWYREVMFYVPFQQLLLLPPVLYFYMHFLLDKDFIFTKRHLVHLLPAAAYLVYSLVVFVVDKFILREHFFYADGRDKDFSTWYQVAGFISLLVYLVLALRAYRRYRVRSYDSLSFADAVLFRWAQLFLLALLLLLVLRGLFFLTNPEWAQFGRKFWYYLSFSILFYYLSINGYVNSIRSFVSLRNAPPRAASAGDVHTVQEEAVKVHEESGEQPGKPSAPIDNLEDWKRRIEKLLVQDRHFTNPELTVSDLAALLDTNPKKVSQIIRQGYDTNFNDFVNNCRTNEVMRKLQAGEHSLQTLLGIAMDCGFNSKSTFNRAFKRATGTTPKGYLQQLKEKEVSNPDMPRSSGEV